MRILCIGDTVGEIGCSFILKHLPSLKKIKNIDMVIANGENSANGNGITPSSAESLFSCGVDVITTGNHSFRKHQSYDYYDTCPYLLRPLNLPSSAPGKGFCIFDMGKYQVCVVNMLGTVFMESLENPFECIDKFLENIEQKIIILDFHAEATAEKQALAYYLDGRISALFGTHTHVQTSDERILDKGTGFITDVGMCGPINSVLGVKSELAIKKMKDKLPVRFYEANGDCKLDAVLFDVNEITGKTVSIERIEIK